MSVSLHQLFNFVTVAKAPRQRRTQVTVKSAAILVDGPEFAGHQRNKWDVSRSVRFNQDAQRQEDIIRLRDMVNYLTRLRMGADKMDRHKQKEVRVEICWVLKPV